MGHGGGLVCNQRGDIDTFGEVFAAAEGRDFDDEVDIDFLGVEAFDEVVSSEHGTAGGEYVIVNNHDVVFGNSVAVHFDGIGAVFFGVGLADCVGGEFAGFAGGNETGAEFEGEDRTADEAAGFDADDFGDTFIAIELR